MNKKILIVGAGIEQTIAIKEAKKLGYTVIACDGNPKAKGAKYADTFVCCDIRKVSNLVDIGTKYKVGGIFCHAVELPVEIAQAAKKLGLPGLPINVAKRCTNKLERLEALSKSSVNIPKYEKIFTLQDLYNFFDSLDNKKVVVKPTDNAGARGITIVKDKDKLWEAFSLACDYTKLDYLLVEEYVKPKVEISTETLVVNGKMYHFGLADRNYESGFGPAPVENGHSVPDTLKNHQRISMISEIERAINALGIKNGIAKGDIIIDKEGNTFIIEMACRTSGGWFSAGTVPAATGVNILNVLIRLAMGENFKEEWMKKKYNKFAVQRYIIPKKKMVFKKLKGLTEARKSYGVVKIDTFPPKSGTQVSRATNNAERWGHIIAVGDTYEEALVNCETAIEKIKIISE